MFKLSDEQKAKLLNKIEPYVEQAIPVLEKIEPALDKINNTPKPLFEAVSYFVIGIIITPFRLRKANAVVQKIRNNESITLREAYRLDAGIAAVAFIVASGALVTHRHSRNLYQHLDNKNIKQNGMV